jgi:hypothetical protein
VASSKQRRADIVSRRAKRKTRAAERAPRPVEVRPAGAVDVTPAALAPYNSYGSPLFVTRGYYVDVPFRCADCGVDAVFTAAQQKWWYELAKGQVYSTAKRCQACRRKRKPVPPIAPTE